jgi:haloalkane dehalogenase
VKRASAFALLSVVGLALLAYTVGLGVYAVSSTRPAVATQPRDAAEARRTLEARGRAAEYPFESRFAATPHGRMHYVEAGSGTAVLALHGNPTWSFLWRRLLRDLAGEMRVVAPDLIGFGLSEKLREPADYTLEGHVDDVEALLLATDLRDVVLVVHGWGGPVGLGVALRQPDRVRALVATNTFGFVPASILDGSAPALVYRLIRLPVLGEQVVQGRGRLPGVAPAYTAPLGNWYERAGALAFLRMLPTRADAAAAGLLAREDRFLREFAGPVRLVWGMRDSGFGPHLLAEWRERVPHAQIVELPEAGHFVPDDAPDALVQAVRALVGRAAQP